MEKYYRGEKDKSRKLATKISLIAGGILTIVFTVLIVFTVSFTQKSMKKSIYSEFQSLSKTSGIQVQQIITTAENSAADIQAYINKAYSFARVGKRNMLNQDFKAGESKAEVISNRTYISSIYNVPISEMSADVEKYLTETARNTVVQNSEIEGVGIMFEHNAFGGEIEDYAFYIDETDGDKPIEPYGKYSDFSQEDFYKKAVSAKDLIFTDPFTKNGIMVVSAAMPIYFNNVLQCVIKFDLNVQNFSKIENRNAEFPSMYTRIYNENGNIVYDASSELIGRNIEEFFTDPKEKEMVREGMSSDQVFQTTRTNDNSKVEAFYYPIKAGGSYWWSMTALDQKDLNRSAVVCAVWLIIISVAALLITAGWIGYMLKSILKPIENLVVVAESIAKGNLDMELKADSNDEIGRLSQAFGLTVKRLKTIINDINYLLDNIADGNFDIRSKVAEDYVGEFENVLLTLRKIVTNLSGTLTQINQSSASVSSGSEQVSSGAQALSQGTTQQASSVEELLASINEVSSKVGDNAVSAEHARVKTAAVGTELVTSNQKMQKMTDAMTDIRLSANEIHKIIKTIEDIAFQTNILALNAAVEAARAGNAGKGFAVVAEEVRNLASKSAEASKSTAELIGHSIISVENGTEIAKETAKSLMAVVSGAKEVELIISEIAESSREQADSIAQITLGIDQISSVVQTNSATAQESAAASEELSGQAQLLKQLVDRFKLRK